MSQSDLPKSQYCFTASPSGERMCLTKKSVFHGFYVTSPVILGMAERRHHVLNYQWLALNTENKPTDFALLREGSEGEEAASWSSIFLDSAFVNPSNNRLGVAENHYLSLACRTILLLFLRQYHYSNY